MLKKAMNIQTCLFCSLHGQPVSYWPWRFFSSATTLQSRRQKLYSSPPPKKTFISAPPSVSHTPFPQLFGNLSLDFPVWQHLSFTRQAKTKCSASNLTHRYSLGWNKQPYGCILLMISSKYHPKKQDNIHIIFFPHNFSSHGKSNDKISHNQFNGEEKLATEIGLYLCFGLYQINCSLWSIFILNREKILSKWIWINVFQKDFAKAI